MALDIVSDYITEARRLLQDQVVEYRYPDDDIVSAMNLAILEVRRLRPELFMVQARTGTLPTYSAGNQAQAVAVDFMYRSAVLYYIVGHMSLRDDEVSEDQRATVFKNKFVAQLLDPRS